MGEGVDTTQMCQSLVDKMGRFEQLKVVADPELLVLFEEWLEEIAEELVSLSQESRPLDPAALGQKLGISRAGVEYLLAKLRREGRLPASPGT